MDALDPAWVQAQLLLPPFVTIEGVSNVRSLGNYPSATSVGHFTKPNFMFRAAKITDITSTGKQQLEQLGIKKAFDLRSETELEKFGSPTELISEVQIIHVPVFRKEDYSPEIRARRYKLYASGKIEAFMELYSQILDGGVLAYSTIFKHIRDRPDEAFLFHCTAGKDRTGVLAALILKLAGVENDTVAKDYALTRVGWDDQRAVIMARLADEPIFADRKAASNMLESRHETMIAFLALLDDKYGGVETYLKHNLGFSNEDVTSIRRNLVSGSRL